MSERKKRKSSVPAYGGSGGTAPISAAGGMSPAERVAYIQEIQQASPVKQIAKDLKEFDLKGFGLIAGIFSQGSAALKGVIDAYTQIRQSRGGTAINQHVEGLTENVRGLERLRHEFAPQSNIDLPDFQNLEEQKKGVYVDSSWTPKRKGKVE
ncbi:hypothetical protein NO1_0436 [Candidatus Termititenax aidoneus]|uniref:Uncharacterized protein n=1 Tax=Termititenax aidoneus TaxID=2218524 RepID=A0A388T9D6_TERA1|nr:hypothetical protein NO1_0436 [Candidatus Termititenax aidoneus]